jgi:hypothetical protein
MIRLNVFTVALGALCAVLAGQSYRMNATESDRLSRESNTSCSLDFFASHTHEKMTECI